MATFVLVHPAWFGGWCWKKVATILRARGNECKHQAQVARCPLYPQKRTSVERVGMSALRQKRTHAVQQKGLLFEHRVGAGQQ
jgi:hypothetical protein